MLDVKQVTSEGSLIANSSPLRFTFKEISNGFEDKLGLTNSLSSNSDVEGLYEDNQWQRIFRVTPPDRKTGIRTANRSISFISCDIEPVMTPTEY